MKFDNPDMTWKRVLFLSVISAVTVAVLNCIPVFQLTSFTAPAETAELWTVLAIYIVMKCKGYKEAMVKTFVFFLISQPLIYLLEVPFKADGWGLFRYYPFWGIMTVLTIPAALMAYRVKKGDWLSALILTIANGSIILEGFVRIGSLIYEFPRYLITFTFCIAAPFVMIFLLLKEKKSRIIGLVLAILILIGGFYYYVINPLDTITGYPLPEEKSWTVTSVSGSGIKVEVEDGDSLTVSSHTNGTYYIVLEAEDGTEIKYKVTVEGGSHNINLHEITE